MTRIIMEGGWGWRASGVLTETRRHGGFFGGYSVGGEMFDCWWELVGWWLVGGELGDADDAAAGVLVD
jgi:hypothetical protein